MTALTGNLNAQEEKAGIMDQDPPLTKLQEYLTVKEAAALTGASERTIWRWVDSDKVKSIIAPGEKPNDPPRRLILRASLPMKYGGKTNLSVTNDTPLPPDIIGADVNDVILSFKTAIENLTNLQAQADRQAAAIENLPGILTQMTDNITAQLESQARETQALQDELSALREELSRRRPWWLFWKRP